MPIGMIRGSVANSCRAGISRMMMGRGLLRGDLDRLASLGEATRFWSRSPRSTTDWDTTCGSSTGRATHPVAAEARVCTEQYGRTRVTRHSSRAEIVDVLRVRSLWPAKIPSGGRGDPEQQASLRHPARRSSILQRRDWRLPSGSAARSGRRSARTARRSRPDPCGRSRGHRGSAGDTCRASRWRFRATRTDTPAADAAPDRSSG